MNIYDALITDHRTVVDLLQQAERATPQQRAALIQTALDELTAHATAEEELFYGAVEGADDAHDLVVEAKEEHLSAARLMSDLLLPNLSDELRQAKAKVLREQLEHHIEEEEEEMFSSAEELIDDEAAEALAGEFLARKAALMELSVEERVAHALKTLLAAAQGGRAKAKSDGVAAELRG